MARFLTGDDLEKVVYDIIWDAEQILLIVSPFIKLDDYFKILFDNHINNPKLHIIIVFGKNERQVSKSLSKDDFEFFKKFLNISIIYVPNLHGKYYGNEIKGVTTSINLLDTSFQHNVEFGIYVEQNFLDKLTASTDQKAWEFCMQMAEDNEAVFIKRPVYEKKAFSALLGKSYVKSDILLDNTNTFYSGLFSRSKPSLDQTLKDFPEYLELNSERTERPLRHEVEDPEMGYCIRTGIKIPFNPKRPFSESAYRSWVEHKNYNYPEKFCHKTGKLSHGKTSMNNPILK